MPGPARNKIPGPEAPPPPFLEFREVGFSFGNRQVLAPFSLMVHEPASLCVVGPNGGGKSTLLRLLLGLLEPDAGWIRIKGHPPGAIRGRMGYVPQAGQWDPLFPIRVSDVVKMGSLRRRTWRWGAGSSGARVDAVLDELGLIRLRSRPFSELSGGERQRVLIARALVDDPEILLLDEPMAHVDRVAEDAFFRQLLSLRRDRPVILVTHHLQLVPGMVERVLCVNGTVHLHQTSSPEPGEWRHWVDRGLRMVRHEGCETVPPERAEAEHGSGQ